MRPIARQRTVRFVVASEEARVYKACRLRMCPARTHRIYECFFPNNARMRLMRTIEADAAPIHELIAAPGRRHPHCVVVIEHPDAALGDTAWRSQEHTSELQPRFGTS